MQKFTINSKLVTKGDLFIAITGFKDDGHMHIAEAIKRGASHVIAEKSPAECNLLGTVVDQEIFQLADGGQRLYWQIVADSKIAYAKQAKQLWPKQPMHLAAITGTNGKTSIAWFYQQLAAALGYNSGFIGTLGALGADRQYSAASGLTTPDAVDLHHLLHQMAEDGVSHLAMEASSHALAQHRLHCVEFGAAAFSNFSQDHLDYHHNMENYWQAKTMLFSQLLPAKGVAVLNHDIPQYDELCRICQSRGQQIISYGMSDGDISFQQSTISIMGHSYEVCFQPVGDFQRYNLMAAIGLLLVGGVEARQMVPAIASLKAPAGRLELVATYKGASIMIDYAHSPDALARVLQTLRPLAKNLHLVFGCGGDRDASKRSFMGDFANKLADYIIITDDNPRNEDPQIIRQEIIRSCPKAKEIASRSEAIAYAIGQLAAGDILLVAGKGHEEYQTIGMVKHYFSDRQEILSFVGDGL